MRWFLPNGEFSGTIDDNAKVLTGRTWLMFVRPTKCTSWYRTEGSDISRYISIAVSQTDRKSDWEQSGVLCLWCNLSAHDMIHNMMHDNAHNMIHDIIHKMTRNMIHIMIHKMIQNMIHKIIHKIIHNMIHKLDPWHDQRNDSQHNPQNDPWQRTRHDQQQCILIFPSWHRSCTSCIVCAKKHFECRVFSKHFNPTHKHFSWLTFQCADLHPSSVVIPAGLCHIAANTAFWIPSAGASPSANKTEISVQNWNVGAECYCMIVCAEC